MPLAADALRRTIFKIVPNENNNGRNKVEGGELCLRKNGRGVDTNRNWEVDWGKKEKDYDPYEEYPGADTGDTIYTHNRERGLPIATTLPRPILPTDPTQTTHTLPTAGTRALSEPEVQMLKATLEGFRPHAWVRTSTPVSP